MILYHIAGSLLMRSRFLTSVTMVAVLASAPVPLAMAQSRPAPDQGFCRNAAPLPNLGPEARPQRQGNDDFKTRGDAKHDREAMRFVRPAPH